MYYSIRYFYFKKKYKNQTYDDVYFIVYKTVNLLKTENDNHRFYVGQHIQYNKQPNCFDGYLGSGTIMENSIKKYGKENFMREILEICNSEYEMNCKEIFWIEKLHANCILYPNCGGMNQTNGGQRNFLCGNNNPNKIIECSEESRNKMRKARTGKYIGEKAPFYGRHHTKEAREKMRLANVGRKMTDEQREKVLKYLPKVKNGYDNINNKHFYFLSNGEDYWIYFNDRDRNLITKRFNHHCVDVIKYKGVIIRRVLKDVPFDEIKIDLNFFELTKIVDEGRTNNRYEYQIPNGDFKTFFNSKEKKSIINKFIRLNTDQVIYKNIIIKRILLT